MSELIENMNINNETSPVPPRMNRLNDRFIKFLFGTERNKALLIDFINDALLLEGDSLITDITFNASELVRDSYDAKLSRLDISAQMSDGHTVDIEVQIVNYHDFAKRFPYYWAVRHVRQMKVGMSYLEMKPTILICILAFNVIDEDDYRNVYGIQNKTTNSVLCDDMTIVFLELPKFRDFMEDLEDRKPSGLERWLIYFSEEEVNRLSQVAQLDPMIFTAMMMEKEFWSNEAEREQYFIAQRQLMDAMSAEKSTQIWAHNEGKLEGKLEVIKNMQSKGLSPSQIAELSGLGENELQALLASQA